MIPICIVTKDRHKLLDVTLRSLCASEIALDQHLVIFEDGSEDLDTLRYLTTDEPVSLAYNWPQDWAWKERGLDAITSRQIAPGLQGLVSVVSLGRASGVVNASCLALCRMAEMYGTEAGIIMCQDDVVFNPDWFPRMMEVYACIEGPRPIGLICGSWINHKDERTSPATLIPSRGVTAQCYYITPEGLTAVLPWAKDWHAETEGFDNMFCAAIRSSADVYLMSPAVCQHIGVESLVRPGIAWKDWDAWGHIDYTAKGPFPLASEIRPFKSYVDVR